MKNKIVIAPNGSLFKAGLNVKIHEIYVVLDPREKVFGRNKYFDLNGNLRNRDLPEYSESSLPSDLEDFKIKYGDFVKSQAHPVSDDSIHP